MPTSPLTATQLTPAGTGAIAVIHLRATDPHRAEPLLTALTKKNTLAKHPVGTITRTSFFDAEGIALDDGLLIRTTHNEWELHLHGGTAVTSALLDRLKELGTAILPPNSNTLEALLAQCHTITAARLVLHQPAALRRWASEWQAKLSDATFPLWRFHSAAQWVLTRSQSLHFLLHPPRIAIIGPPNAGKSTLANALLGRPAAITSDIAGTTRDWVDGEAILAHADIQLAITLVDTAGIRETPDTLEQQSIQRTHAQAQTADLILALYDATRRPTHDELQLSNPRPGQPVIPAVNKVDLAPHIPAPLAERHAVSLSAKVGTGLPEISRRILTAFDLADIRPDELLLHSKTLQDQFTRLAQTDTAEACIQLLDALKPPTPKSHPHPK